MRKSLVIGLCAALAITPVLAQSAGGSNAPLVALLSSILARIPGLNAAGQSPVSDPNNAAYSSAAATFATGATVAAGRAILLICPASPGSGSVTLTLQGGGSIVYPVAAGASVLPFAVTAVSADTASCTHQNIN